MQANLLQSCMPHEPPFPVQTCAQQYSAALLVTLEWSRATQQRCHHGTFATESRHLPPPSPLITKAMFLFAHFMDSKRQPTHFPVLHKKVFKSAIPSNHHCSDRLSLPPCLCSCPSSPLHPNCTTSPQYKQEKRVRWCLENGIRSKLFLLIRHLSTRAVGSALELEGCHRLY